MLKHEELVPLEPASPVRVNHSPYSVVNIEPQGAPSYSELRAYWQVLVKHLGTILTVAFVITVLVAIASFKMRPVYQATARVEVEAEAPQIQSLNDLDRSFPSDQSFLRTQVKVLESDNLAWRTIQQLGLAENPDFAPPDLRREQQLAGSAAAAPTRLIREFKARLQVELVRDSRLIEISFESTDPKLAVQVANALVSNYTEYNFHKRYDATRQASGWMEQQLDELKAKVENSQQALVDYEREHAIVNVSEKQNVVEQRLADLSRDLTNAQSDRMQKESLYELVKSNETQVAFIAQNDLLQRLEEKYADLNGQYIDGLGQYGPNFPRVVRLRSQVNEILAIIDRERKRIVGRIHNDYVAALGREKLLSGAVSREKSEIGTLNQLLIQHNILKREFETNQQLYENLLQRLKDATVSAGLRATNIHIVDSALPPSLPVRPKKLLNILLGMVGGLILGIVIAFIKEGLDDSIKTPEDLEAFLATPALAVIPPALAAPGRLNWLRIRRERDSAPDEVAELAVLRQPGSALAESYRSLRTSILLSAAPHPPQALLVTSAHPKEGKSCTSLNLAVALAQRGNRVVIIDSDLRKPRIGPALGLSDEKGLSTLLAGTHTLDEALQQVVGLPNLWVLPAGPRPTNPAELLSSSNMEKLTRELRQNFEHLVLDSPPLLMVTDATVLSTLVDGVLLVVESGTTARGALVRARRILENAGGKILGAVLNKADLRRDGYYGYPYAGSYSYYADREAEKTSRLTGTSGK